MSHRFEIRYRTHWVSGFALTSIYVTFPCFFQFRSGNLQARSKFPCSPLSDKGKRFVVPSAQPRTERESWQSRGNRSIRVSKINRYLSAANDKYSSLFPKRLPFPTANVNKPGFLRQHYQRSVRFKFRLHSALENTEFSDIPAFHFPNGILILNLTVLLE